MLSMNIAFGSFFRTYLSILMTFLGMQTSRATRELLEIDSQKARFEFEFKRTEPKRAELD